VALLDDLLKLLGTNRTRMQWKLRAWKRGWERRVGSVKNRAQALSYEHQTCPRCSHPASADEKICTRCNEPLGGKLAHRARRLAGMMWIEGAPVVATVLIAAIGTLYVTTLVWGTKVGLSEGFALSPHPLAFARFGDLDTRLVQEGEWWRLSTGTFLHVNVMHIVFNVMSLYSVARYLEDVLGKGKTLALYLGLGLVASLVSFAWHAYRFPYFGNSAGASGAVCGLIGVAIGFSLRKRNVARHLRAHYVGWAIWIAVIGLSGWKIDNAGHFGGLVPGVVIGLVVRRRADTGAVARRVWTYAALVLVAITFASLVLAARQRIPDETIEAWRASHGSHAVAD
jgi:membrane associated rhomboid family serine protease